MTAILKGNLAEHAYGCAHCQWWQGVLVNSGRKTYPLTGQVKHYAPDMPFDVRHVKLVIDVDPTKATLSGVCHSTLEPIAKPISRAFFQSEDIVVTRASIGGGAESLAFEKLDNGYEVTLPKEVAAGDTVEVALEYHIQKPKAGIFFTGPDYNYKEPYQVWTQGQDEHNHHWFPVAGADYPNHKMTTEMVVTVPKRFTALSNGKLMHESVNEEKDTRTFHWLLNKPHVSYLVTLCIGVFEKLETMYKDTPVQLYCDPEILPHAKRYFKNTAGLVALFSRLNGVEYPWPGKYAQVMARRFIFGGMENTTMTVMTDRIVADETTCEEFLLTEFCLDAHELFHHWHGDFLTCVDWSHASSGNEGRAKYSEAEAVEHFFGKKERDFHLKKAADTYFAEDRGRYRRPIVSSHYAAPIDLFDRHLYQKGALVLHMLRYLLGDDGYYKSTKTYLLDNAYGSVETGDWLKAIQKTTGRNLRKFFDQWYFGAGYPEYGVNYSFDGKVATVKVTQNQKLEEQTGLFTMPVVFSFGFADGSTVDHTVNVDEKENSFHLVFDKKPVMFRFDPEGWILKTVDLKLPKSMLLYQLAHDPCLPGRILAAQTLAKQGGEDVVAALEKASNSEFFYGLGVECAKLLGTMGSTAARLALMRLASHKSPFVRRSVAQALGNFKNEEVADILIGLLCGPAEKSVFVKADAAASLGKTKSPKAFETLKCALSIESWNQMVRIGVLNGLAELGDERSIDLAIAYSGADKPFEARPAAFSALGKLGVKHEKAAEHLHKLAEEADTKQFTLLMSLVGALGETKKPEAVPVLNRLSSEAGDGRTKRVIADTIQTLQASKGATGSADVLKTQVEQLTTQVRDLSDKLAAREAAASKPPRRRKKPSGKKPASKKQ